VYVCAVVRGVVWWRCVVRDPSRVWLVYACVVVVVVRVQNMDLAKSASILPRGT
jgi:hypothetical protein